MKQSQDSHDTDTAPTKTSHSNYTKNSSQCTSPHHTIATSCTAVHQLQPNHEQPQPLAGDAVHKVHSQLTPGNNGFFQPLPSLPHADTFVNTDLRMLPPNTSMATSPYEVNATGFPTAVGTSMLQNPTVVPGHQPSVDPDCSSKMATNGTKFGVGCDSSCAQVTSNLPYLYDRSHYSPVASHMSGPNREILHTPTMSNGNNLLLPNQEHSHLYQMSNTASTAPEIPRPDNSFIQQAQGRSESRLQPFTNSYGQYR